MAAKFTPNRAAMDALKRTPEMRAFIDRVADEGADQVRARLPHPGILGGLTVESQRSPVSRDAESEVRVKGPGWHLWEFGGLRNPARPAMRPGVQAAIARYRGRLGESR